MSRDGSTVYATGSSEGSTGGVELGNDYATVAYDASAGRILWTRRYDGPGERADDATALDLSPDGSTLFVTGESVGANRSLDYATVANDASTGDRLWTGRYHGRSDHRDSAHALGVSPDGSAVFVTGQSEGPSGNTRYATIALAAATGDRLWASRYDGPELRRDNATALGVSPDGSLVFVTGLSTGTTSDYDYTTVAYDSASGTEAWVTRYDGPVGGTDEATGLAVSPDGSWLFVTGNSGGDTDEFNFATVAYDAATGDERWSARYEGLTDGRDAASAVDVTPDGSRVVVTGTSVGATSDYDFATVAYDGSSGDEIWARHYDGAGHDFDAAAALDLSADGAVAFVTGASVGSSGHEDYATIAYDSSTGDRLWLRRYDGPGHLDDAATAVGAVGRARIFVTGVSATTRDDYDFATLAYRVP